MACGSTRSLVGATLDLADETHLLHLVSVFIDDFEVSRGRIRVSEYINPFFFRNKRQVWQYIFK